MQLPKTTRQYQLFKVSCILQYFRASRLMFFSLQAGSYKNLEIRETSIPPVKSNEVLVKVHAVSLNVKYSDLWSLDAFNF